MYNCKDCQEIREFGSPESMCESCEDREYYYYDEDAAESESCDL